MQDNNHFEKLLANSYPNQTTRQNYTYRMNTLLRICKAQSMFSIIQNPDIHYELIRDAFPNVATRKNLLTIILVFFKCDESLKIKYPSAHQRWSKLHDDLDGLQEAKYRKNMPDMKQLSKYTPLDEIKAKYNELASRGDPHSTRALSQYFVLLSIALNIPPKRADYGSMRVYYNKEPPTVQGNILILHTNNPNTPSYMAFTRFKTDGKYPRIDEILPKVLYKDITNSLRRWPRNHLFVTKLGDPFASNNGFTKYVIGAFNKLFGRDTGVTMLRHIFITEKSDPNASIEERDELARQMMHSSGLQDMYKWNKEAICSALKHLCNECKKPSNPK